MMELPTTITVNGENWVLVFLDKQTGDTYPPTLENADNNWLDPIYIKE